MEVTTKSLRENPKWIRKRNAKFGIGVLFVWNIKEETETAIQHLGASFLLMILSFPFNNT